MSAHMFHHTHMEFRRQLRAASALLSPLRVWGIESKLSGLQASAESCQAHKRTQNKCVIKSTNIYPMIKNHLNSNIINDASVF